MAGPRARSEPLWCRACARHRVRVLRCGDPRSECGAERARLRAGASRRSTGEQIAQLALQAARAAHLARWRSVRAARRGNGARRNRPSCSRFVGLRTRVRRRDRLEFDRDRHSAWPCPDRVHRDSDQGRRPTRPGRADHAAATGDNADRQRPRRHRREPFRWFPTPASSISPIRAATALVLRGWVGDTTTGIPAQLILVYADGRLVFAGRPNMRRPDVAQALGEPRLVRAGYRIVLPFRDLIAGGDAASPARLLDRRRPCVRGDLHAVLRLALIVASRQQSFQPDVQDDEEVATAHLLQAQLRGAGGSVRP